MSEKWEVGDTEYYGDIHIRNVGEKLVHTIVLKNGFMTDEEVKDRARRIAALPELEANYKEAVDALNVFVEFHQNILNHNGLLPVPLWEVWKTAKEALTKTEGK